jgi:glycosyltransferase 2 family protein
VLATSVLLVTPRWAIILSALGYKIPSASLLPSVFLGFLCNQVLPTGVGGDILRAWRTRQLGVPLNIGVYSVLLDRISGVFTVLVGTAVLVPFTAPLAARGGILWAAGAVVVSGIVGCLGLWAVSTLPPSKFALLRTLQGAIAGFNVSVRAVVRRPHALLGVIVLSIIGQFIAAGAIGLLARDLQIQIAPVDVMVVTFGAMLAATIPISIAGWGIREGALVFLFGLYGVPPQTAFAVSILFGACLIAASAPGALVLLTGSRKPLSPYGDT